MPTVPVINERVQQSALPSPRIDVSAPIEAFGGGKSLNESTRSIQGVADTGISLLREQEKLLKEEKEKADDLATTEALFKLRVKETELLRDPHNGAYTRRGKNALGLPEEYGGKFSSFADELESSLANDDQKAKFRRQRLGREAEFNDTLSVIMSTEYAKYGDELFSASLDAEELSAIVNADDPAKVRNRFDHMDRIIDGWASQRGKPGAWATEEKAKRKSNVHRSIVEKMISERKYGHADGYYRAIEHELLPKERNALKETLSKAKIDYDAASNADKIWDEASHDRKSALDMARKIADPATAEQTRNLLLKRFDDLKNSEEEQHKRYVDSLWDKMDRTRQPLTVGEKDKLTREERSAADAYIKNLNEGIDPPKNSKTYYDHLTLAATAPKEFTRRNLVTLKGRVAESELHELMKMQSDLFKKKDSPELDDHRTKLQIEDQVLRAAGFDLNKKAHQDELYKIRSMAAEQLRALQAQTGKKAANEDYEKIIKNLVTKTVIKRSQYGFDFLARDVEKPTALLEADDFTLDSIPEQERRKIEEALRRANRPVTEQEIIKAFIIKLQAQGLSSGAQ